MVKLIYPWWAVSITDGAYLNDFYMITEKMGEKSLWIQKLFISEN